MTIILSPLKYNQYQRDFYYKLNFDFKPHKKLLDVGCGSFLDAPVFIDEVNLNYYGIDVFTPKNIRKLPKIKFKKASIYSIPYKNNSFDYVFVHDVLHHIDERKQDYHNHLKGLKELKRVCKNGGYIIIVEANRYNPLFYPHMVIFKGHNHWKQSYFMGLITEVFNKPRFSFFECHLYPNNLFIWKLYEKIMEKFSPKLFLAYNTAIIRK